MFVLYLFPGRLFIYLFQKAKMTDNLNNQALQDVIREAHCINDDMGWFVRHLVDAIIKDIVHPAIEELRQENNSLKETVRQLQQRIVDLEMR